MKIGNIVHLNWLLMKLIEDVSYHLGLPNNYQR